MLPHETTRLINEVLERLGLALSDLTQGRHDGSRIWDSFKQALGETVNLSLNPVLERIPSSIEALANAIDRHAVAMERIADAHEHLSEAHEMVAAALADLTPPSDD